MARSGNLPAELEPRASDVRIPALLLPKIPPFSELKTMAKLFNFPGSVTLRKYRKGQVICRQGDPGWTAFYIPKATEIQAIREAPRKQLEIATADLAKAEAQLADRRKQLLEASGDPKKTESLKTKVVEAEEGLEDVKKRIEVLEQSVPYLEKEIVVGPPGAGDATRQVATVQLVLQRSAPERNAFFSSVAAALAGRRRKRTSQRPASIPIDAPRDLDSETLQGVLNEGEIFGEMSCLYRSPRSATVVATRDCYIIEMLRSVLDAMNRDAAFRSGLDRAYRERILGLQLRKILLLSGLDDELVALASQKAELVDLPSGGLLYDQNDSTADGMHLIRSGIIKVMQNVSFLLAGDDIVDWPALRTELREAADAGSGVRHEVWLRLAEGARAETAADADVVAALNGIIKDPALDSTPELRKVAAEQKAGRKVWQRLAAPAKAGDRALHRCQRLLLESIYGSKIPEWKPDPEEEAESYLFRPSEFRDWKATATALLEGAAKPTEPRGRVWQLLAEPVRAVLEEAKGGAEVSTVNAAIIVESLNAILRGRPLIIFPEFQDYLRTKKPAKLVMEFLPDNEAWSEADYHRFCRAYNRFLLDGVFPNGLGTSKRPEGPPRVLTYRSRGEPIGEMALVENSPRTATCVAYSHPDDDPEREVGPTQLVRISKDLFNELRRASAEFDRTVVAIVAQRLEETRERVALQSPRASMSPVHAGQAETLGLYQGQKLMLIDLERCTRCDECVQACVNTHDDGHSRLFLDGPRYGKFLVPSTCRSCLDPVCMIGCPVGSIHRGSNNEIMIEDWCIGCEQCANQCPYGSIQMHTIGIVPGGSHGWRYALATNAPADWYKTARAGRGWIAGSTPFVLDREFQERLNGTERSLRTDASAAPICFQYEFDADNAARRTGQNLVLALTSMDENVRVWINGRSVIGPADKSADATPGKETAGTLSRKKSRDWGWWEIETTVPGHELRAHGNVVSVQVVPSKGNSDRLIDLRLDMEQGVTVKLVEQKAVVCDLCSAQYGQVPACVTACPHDAAIRVNALSQLPLA